MLAIMKYNVYSAVFFNFVGQISI